MDGMGSNIYQSTCLLLTVSDIGFTVVAPPQLPLDFNLKTAGHTAKRLKI